MNFKNFALTIVSLVLIVINISVVKACSGSGKWGAWQDTSSCEANTCDTNIGTKTQKRVCVSSDHSSECDPGKWIDEKWECPTDPAAYTSNNDHKDCKKQFGTWPHKYYKYADKVKVADGYWESQPQEESRTIDCSNAPVYACPPTEPTPTTSPEPTPEITPEVTPTPTEEPAPQPCNGCGGWPSAPTCGATKPTTPQILSIVRQGTTALLTWTASTPVTHYSIVYGLKEGEYIYGAANVGNVTSYTVGSLTPGTKYYFSVRAVNDCMPSDPSSTGQVLGASIGGIGGGEIQGLAFTGNSSLIYFLVSAGFTFLILSLASFRLKGRVA